MMLFSMLSCVSNRTEKKEVGQAESPKTVFL